MDNLEGISILDQRWKHAILDLIQLIFAALFAVTRETVIRRKRDLVSIDIDLITCVHARMFENL